MNIHSSVKYLPPRILNWFSRFDLEFGISSIKFDLNLEFSISSFDFEFRFFKGPVTKSKLKIETRSRNWKSKPEIETRQCNQTSKVELDARNSKLEFKTRKSKLEFKTRIENSKFENYFLVYNFWYFIKFQTSNVIKIFSFVAFLLE